MDIEITRADKRDIHQLLHLYLTVYGSVYPLPLGSDRATMERMLQSASVLWLVARGGDRRALLGSAVFELDFHDKIGKLEGVVVDPACRHQKIAHRMIRRGTTELLQPGGGIHSIYATTRTNTVGPQLMCLNEGFLPLGIFLNAHRLERFESVTLLAKFQPGILARRQPPPPVPPRLKPILDIVHGVLGHSAPVELAVEPQGGRDIAREALVFELIHAPHYVEAKFKEHKKRTTDAFYPFHTANLLLASMDGSIEIFASLSRPDRYCTILSLSQPWSALRGRASVLFDQLADLGASYVEAMVQFNDTDAINSLLDLQFLPSAVYPAMQEKDGVLHDQLIMSRTMQPLNFRGMAVDAVFKPYIDQYTDLWRQMHLDSLKVIA